jgi:hypothetical protein
MFKNAEGDVEEFAHDGAADGEIMVAFASLFTHPAFTLVDQEFELLFDRPQRPSGQRFSFPAKAGNDLGVEPIVLGPAQHRKSEVLHLRGVEHTHRQARLVERSDQSLAINGTRKAG